MAKVKAVRKTAEFDSWLRGLKDGNTRTRIAARIDKLAHGLFGDCEPVGEGVHELREHHGPGYRIYFTSRDKALVILLCGGTKGSQESDIRRAKKLAKEIP